MMKTRNKWFIGSGVALTVAVLLVIGGFTVVSASGPWRGAGGPKFHGRCGGQGFGSHGSEMVDFVFWRLDRQAADLNLSTEQQETYDAWKADIRDHVSQGMEDRRQLMTRVQTELEKPDPDVPMLLESIKAKVDNMAGFANTNLDHFADFWQTLNDDQKQTLLTHIREKTEDCQP